MLCTHVIGKSISSPLVALVDSINHAALSMKRTKKWNYFSILSWMLILDLNKQCKNWLITNNYCKGHDFSLNGFLYFHYDIIGLAFWVAQGRS